MCPRRCRCRPRTEATAHDAVDRGPDRPADEADFRPGLGAVARAGEAARQAGAVVDGRLGPLGADATS